MFSGFKQVFEIYKLQPFFNYLATFHGAFPASSYKENLVYQKDFPH